MSRVGRSWRLSYWYEMDDVEPGKKYEEWLRSPPEKQSPHGYPCEFPTAQAAIEFRDACVAKMARYTATRKDYTSC